MLNIPITRLETWARDDRVPHPRAGVSRGVEYTAEDVHVIGRMLPELMGGRRGGRLAAPTEGQLEDAPAAGLATSAETTAGWLQLKATGPPLVVRRGAADGRTDLLTCRDRGRSRRAAWCGSGDSDVWPINDGPGAGR